MTKRAETQLRGTAPLGDSAVCAKPHLGIHLSSHICYRSDRLGLGTVSPDGSFAHGEHARVYSGMLKA